MSDEPFRVRESISDKQAKSEAAPLRRQGCFSAKPDSYLK